MYEERVEYKDAAISLIKNKIEHSNEDWRALIVWVMCAICFAILYVGDVLRYKNFGIIDG